MHDSLQAGTTNPTVALFLVNMQNSNKQELSVPTDKVTADHILGTVFWINDQTLGAIWMNRRQNRGVFVSYDATTFERTEVSYKLVIKDIFFVIFSPFVDYGDQRTQWMDRR